MPKLKLYRAIKSLTGIFLVLGLLSLAAIPCLTAQPAKNAETTSTSQTASAEWEIALTRQLRDFLLRERFPGQEERLTVSLREVDKVETELKKILGQAQVPDDLKGKFFLSAKAKLEGNVVIPAEIYWHDKLIQSVVLPVKITLKVQVIVAQVKVERGKVVAAKDIALKSIDNAYTYHDVFRDPGQVIGRETKVPLYPGTLVAKWMIQEVPAVHRGDNVTLVAACDNVELKIPAVAQQDGYIGDKVRVKAPTGKVLTGQLAAKSLVMLTID